MMVYYVRCCFSQEAPPAHPRAVRLSEKRESAHRRGRHSTIFLPTKRICAVAAR